MAEFLEDPSVLTKDKLKNELAANNVALPSGEHKKEVYVQLYLKNLTAQNNKRSPPVDTFSSDDELPAPVVSNKSRSGRVSLSPNLIACLTRHRAPLLTTGAFSTCRPESHQEDGQASHRGGGDGTHRR